MSIRQMTDGGCTIGSAEMRNLRRFLAQVSAMHPVEGDTLGAAARRWAEDLRPYEPPQVRPPAAAEPLPRPAHRPAEWWTTKDKPTRPEARRYTEVSE